MEAHPVAALFPMLNDTDLQSLAKDIKEHGQRDPILVFKGQVLDGRNRLRACELAGVEPRIEEYEDNPAGIPKLIVSKNVHRRHLTTRERTEIAAKLATMEVGDNQHTASKNLSSNGSSAPDHEGVSSDTPSPLKISTAAAADLMNVSKSSVDREKRRKRTDPEGSSRRGEQPKKEASKSDAPPAPGTYYTNNQGFTQRFKEPKDVIEFLRGYPAQKVVNWLIEALGTDRFDELLETRLKASDADAAAQEAAAIAAAEHEAG
jgi:ParB-like nuclease domain